MTAAIYPARHYLISGKVQGVYYRLSAQARARELGLVGWVRNLVDGRVEALAMGESQSLEAFERWLWQGPERARVEAVDINQISVPQYQNFDKYETAEQPISPS